MKNIHETTIQLLSDTKIPLPIIAKGSGVGYRWLCKLVAGQYSDPGVNKIQRVHDYLSSLMKEAA